MMMADDEDGQNMSIHFTCNGVEAAVVFYFLCTVALHTYLFVLFIYLEYFR